MSGWYRVTVVKPSNNETVRTFEVHVPEHPHPVALGVGPDGNPTPREVEEAAAKGLKKKGEQVGHIVHITPDSGPATPSVADLELQIARLQAQLEAQLEAAQ